MGALPDFLFIGPSKTASTFLWSVLGSSDHIAMPASKEYRFFDTYYKRGLGWYAARFPDRPQDVLSGEFSHDYVLSGSPALGRISRDLPDVKLVVCYRDPYERLLSGVQFLERNGWDKGDLGGLCQRHPELIVGGLYGRNMFRLFELFEASRVHIIDFAEIRRDERAVALALAEFLGLPAFGIRGDVVRNAAALPRSPLAAKVVKTGALAARASGLEGLVTTVKSNRAIGTILYRPRESKSELLPADRRWLTSFFEPDRELLVRVLRDVGKVIPRG